MNTTTETNSADVWAAKTEMEYGPFKDTFADAPLHSAKYLMQYGYAKSLQDSVAGMRKEMEAEKNEDGSAKHTEEQIVAALTATMQKRRDAIWNGTIGLRGPAAPKLSTRDSTIDKVAKEFLRNAAANKKKKLPKVGEGYAELLAGFLEKNRAAIEAEADRRIASDVDSLEF